MFLIEVSPAYIKADLIKYAVKTCSNTVNFLYIICNLIMAKLNVQQPLLQSSVSHDPSKKKSDMMHK